MDCRGFPFKKEDVVCHKRGATEEKKQKKKGRKVFFVSFWEFSN